MINNEIKKNITKFIHGILNNKNLEIKDNSKLISDNLIDSLGIIQIITYLESKYEIQINQDELNLENFETINNIVILVENKTK